MAIGINWYRAITGRELIFGALLDKRPLWCEPYGEVQDFNEQAARIVTELEAGFLKDQLATTELSDYEREMIGKLVRLELT